MERNHKPNKGKQPFCWLEKPKLLMIDDIFSENTGLGNIESARSIYLALAEIASDNERDDRLEISQAAIARRAGLSVSTVKRILPVFARLGLVKIKRNSINGMETRSIYTLVRGALAHGELALAQAAKIKRATSEECTEECFEGTARNKDKRVSSTCNSSLAGKGNGFNQEKDEYEW